MSAAHDRGESRIDEETLLQTVMGVRSGDCVDHRSSALPRPEVGGGDAKLKHSIYPNPALRLRDRPPQATLKKINRGRLVLS